MDILDPRVPQRIWDKISPEPNSQCWIWLGTTAGEVMPQTRWKVDGKWKVRAVTHVLLEAAGTPTDEAAYRRCRNKFCVNPAHCVATTVGECSKIASQVRRQGKTSCSNGHPFTPDNLYVYYHSGEARYVRHCKTCQSAASALLTQRRVQERLAGTRGERRREMIRRHLQGKQIWARKREGAARAA